MVGKRGEEGRAAYKKCVTKQVTPVGSCSLTQQALLGARVRQALELPPGDEGPGIFMNKLP